MATRKTAASIYQVVTSPASLMGTYEKYVKNGSARGRDGQAPAALAGELEAVCQTLSDRMRSGQYRFTQYRQLLTSRGENKNPRVISIPSAQDRITLRALADLLGEVYPEARCVIPQVVIGRVQKALEIDAFDSFIRLDVQDFFPSISHQTALKKLSRKIRKKEIIDTIMRALETPTVPDGARRRPVETRGTPQGLAISNLLAELIAQPVDKAMYATQECAYFRFVDDVLLLCNSSQTQRLHRKVSHLLEKQGLRVHEISPNGKSSIGPLAAGFDYLGYVFSGRRVSVRPASVHRLESSLARSFTRYKRSADGNEPLESAIARCQWHVNLTISGCIYKGSFRGWLPYFRQMNDFTLLKRLDATVRRFKKRFGMPDDFTTKTFMTTYWALRHPGGNHGGYIPNFDTVSIESMRSILLSIFGIVEVFNLSDDDVSRLFHSRVGNAVSSMENDVGPLS
jgi:RNA-directed DNA polymerase